MGGGGPPPDPSGNVDPDPPAYRPEPDGMGDYCGEPFIDTDFPADASVIDIGAQDQAQLGQRGVPWPPTWLRALHLNRGEKRTLIDDINFDDPKQGIIGDCWLIVAMSSAALKHGDAIKALF